MNSTTEKTGRITISRTDSNQGPSYVTVLLSYRDGDTDVRLETELSLEDFAMVLTGLARVPVDVKIFKHGCWY